MLAKMNPPENIHDVAEQNAPEAIIVQAWQ
jgi:hypothetical protein